jgi:uncharacterized protein (DUF1330 family)
MAVANLRNVAMGPAIIEYLERIDDTLIPFGGRFIVHGGEAELIEGRFSGHLIILEFDDRKSARDWYESPAYRAILQLRTDHSEADVIFIDTVPPDHCATDVLAPAKLMHGAGDSRLHPT